MRVSDGGGEASINRRKQEPLHLHCIRRQVRPLLFKKGLHCIFIISASQHFQHSVFFLVPGCLLPHEYMKMATKCVAKKTQSRVERLVFGTHKRSFCLYGTPHRAAGILIIPDINAIHASETPPD